jgi:AsmA protein
MRPVKMVALALGVLIAVVVLALLAVWLLVNPNDYKPQIAAAVKRATGRELVLEGNLALSVFPWIALELGPASLGNPSGFPAQPFVSFKHASVRVKLLPLLAKRLEIGRVELDGLDLKLLTNEAGKGNWEGFGRSEGTAPAPATETPSGGGIPEFAGFKITNARVSYEDLVLENVSLETGSIGRRDAAPVSLHVDAHRGPAGPQASLDARFDLRTDRAERYSLRGLTLTSAVTLAGNPRPLRFHVSAPAVDLDLKAETLSAPSLQVNASGAVVNASVGGTKILEAMNLRGTVKLEPVVLHEVLPPLGVALPKTRDAQALSRLAASSDFAYGKNTSQLQFENVEATLDDTHLKGSLGLDTATEAVNFALTVDTLDLDRYLPPPSPAGAPTPAAEPQPKAAESESKPLDANGTLAVGSLHFAPLNLSNVKVTVATNDRVMHIHPLKAQVNGGDYSGDITLDRHARTPVISMDEHLTGIDVAPLVAAGSKSLHVTGRGNVNLKATARGDGADAILKTLNGRFDANIANGAVEGIDLGYELGVAEALIRRQAPPAAQNTKRTQFTAFKLSADIVNGVAQTHDLLISSAVLKVTGQGSINLPAKTLDVSLLADTLQVAGNTPIQVPVKVTGSLADPAVRPDIEALAKSQVKQKLQNVLQDKLKGLFGKP